MKLYKIKIFQKLQPKEYEKKLLRSLLKWVLIFWKN